MFEFDDFEKELLRDIQNDVSLTYLFRSSKELPKKNDSDKNLLDIHDLKNVFDELSDIDQSSVNSTKKDNSIENNEDDSDSTILYDEKKEKLQEKQNLKKIKSHLEAKNMEKCLSNTRSKRKINKIIYDSDYDFEYENSKKVKKIRSENKEIKISIFIQKLFNICSDKNNNKIIDFYDEGGIIIYDTNIFSETILTTYYKNIKINSIFRMLNIYGFRKVFINYKNEEEKKTVIYKNIYFLKNNESKLLELMSCKQNTQKSFFVFKDFSPIDSISNSNNRSSSKVLTKINNLIKNIELIKKNVQDKHKNKETKSISDKIDSIELIINKIMSNLN